MNYDRIASFSAQGLNITQIANIVGLSVSRISQITKEEKYQLILDEKQAEIEKVDIEEASITSKYVAAEHALIQQVMEMAPVSELRDVTAALRVVSERQEKMKTRTTVVPPQQMTQVNVSISLPAHAIPGRTIEMTSNKQVIAIGNQTLAPLSSNAVTNLFASLKGGNQNEQSPSIAESEESSSEAPAEEASFLTYAAAQ